MTIPIEPMQVLEMDLPQAYKTLAVLEIIEAGNKEIKDTREIVEKGIKEKFYIMSYLNNRYKDNWKNKTITIEGKVIEHEEFYKEINQRLAKAISVIIKYTEIPDIMGTR